MSNFWEVEKERMQELTTLKAEGRTWKEIAELTEYPGKAQSLNRDFNQRRKHAGYEDPVKTISSRVRAQKSARLARSEMKPVVEAIIQKEDLLSEIRKSLSNIKIRAIEPVTVPEKAKGSMVCEALISDIQIGKVTPDYNSKIAIKRMAAHGHALLLKIQEHQQAGYVFDKIILAFMGDIIESTDKAAAKNSPLSTDSNTTEQIVNATRGIFENIIVPIAQLGVEVEVIGVPGNHDHRKNGMIMDKAGLVCDTWIIYNMLEMLCASNYPWVRFNITEGMYCTADIYGHTAVYEHGYGLAVNDTALLNRQNQRSRQEQTHITYFRMGDKHSINRFDEDQRVVNGAYFGMSAADKGDDYSSAMGYAARAGQIAFFHVPRRKGDDRLPCYDSFVIQLPHIK